jgi:EAL domain-containing protein (putative c-di-GMP-specific phosphodiesterase class I)
VSSDREWRETFAGELSVSVNVSNREFWHGGLLEHVVAALARNGLNPDVLTLEITEGVIMHNPELALGVMEELHAHGLQLHIDDFGTGYSSLHALHRFPIQGLKIDRSFVNGVGADRKTMELVNTIVTMGRNLGVDVVAEGVETLQQREWLRDMAAATGRATGSPARRQARGRPAARAGAADRAPCAGSRRGA